MVDVREGVKRVKRIRGEATLAARSGEPHLFVLNEDGDILLQKKLEHEAASKVIINQSNDIILCTVKDFDKDIRTEGSRMTYVLNEEGDILAEFPFHPNASIIASDYLVLGTKGKIVYVDRHSWTVRWEYNDVIGSVVLLEKMFGESDQFRSVSRIAGEPVFNYQVINNHGTEISREISVKVSDSDMYKNKRKIIQKAPRQ